MTNSSETSTDILCDNCETVMAKTIREYLFHCKICLLWRSSLTPKIGDGSADSIADARQCYESLRRDNARAVLNSLKNICELNNTTMLDVGCAQGWFMSEAQKFGMEVTGVEPERSVAIRGIKIGLDIRINTFPEALSAGERFGVISFNDVFEHLPQPLAILSSCFQHLHDNGLLIINVPDSRGIIFRLAHLFRLEGMIRRLWQADFYSPHLYYYETNNLERLAKTAGFLLRCEKRINVTKVTGLWERLRLTNAPSWKRLLYYVAALVSTPMLNYVLPSDTSVFIFEKRKKSFEEN